MPPTQEKKITISKENVLKDPSKSREVNLDLVHLIMMLKNEANSRKVDHDLQRKVLKDTGNSKEVDLDLVHLTMMLKNTTNSRKVGHNLQRKVLKDAANSGKEDHDLQRKRPERSHNSKEVDLRSSSFDYDAEKHHQLKKSRSQSPKKSPERHWQFKRS